MIGTATAPSAPETFASSRWCDGVTMAINRPIVVTEDNRKIAFGGFHSTGRAGAVS